MNITLLYFEVEHPVIYFPGISVLEDDREYQTTFVRIHRLFVFKKQKGFKWSDMQIRIQSKAHTFFRYWLCPVGYGLKNRFGFKARVGIRTAWDLANMFHPCNKN